MNKVWSKTKEVSREERVGIWLSYMLLRVSLLVYIFALAVPGSVKADVFNVAAGDVYGPNGLIAAIEEANLTDESDNIVLASGTYILTKADNNTDCPNGLPSVIHELSISCPTNAIIERGVNADEFRIFHNNTGRTMTGDPFILTLSNITIRGGKVTTSDGGGLFIKSGGVTLINCAVSNNSANMGGGIFISTAILILDKSTISENNAANGGGGFYNTFDGLVSILNSTIGKNTALSGGGFTNIDSTVIMENSSVINNSGGTGSGGGIFNVNGSILKINNSTIFGNRTGHLGGGIVQLGKGILIVTNSNISNNRADNDGGGIASDEGGEDITLTNVIISNNSAGEDGGGIENEESTMTITKSTISRNSTDRQDGGGIENDKGTLTVIDSTIRNNSAGDNGGGIENDHGTLEVIRSTIFGNSAKMFGGGIDNRTPDGNLRSMLTVTNGTFSLNEARDGGGISNRDVATLKNATITNNEANTGGGVENRGTTTLQNTIIAINAVLDYHNDGGGTTNSLGNNLISNPAGGFSPHPSDIIGVNPKLGKYLDNGTPGHGHHPLNADSPAIDAGTNVLIDDQRGRLRPVDGNGDGVAVVDIGAIEFFPVVNNLVSQGPVETSFNSTPVPGGPRGTFTIKVNFTNTSSTPINHPFFQVVELSSRTGGNLLLNADGGRGGVGSTLTPNVGTNEELSVGESFPVEFVIGLQTADPFVFKVDLLGEPAL